MSEIRHVESVNPAPEAVKEVHMLTTDNPHVQLAPGQDILLVPPESIKILMPPNHNHLAPNPSIKNHLAPHN